MADSQVQEQVHEQIQEQVQESGALVGAAEHPASPVDGSGMSSPRSSSVRIRTPDQRVRVFVSSTLQELAPERAVAREAIARLRLTPVLFELGARPHPPRDLYRAYLAQSDIFLGIYWQRYGWIAPGMAISGLEDEYQLAADKPKLMYMKVPAPEREPGLQALLDRIRTADTTSYKSFETADELRELIENDLALLLAERFEREQAVEPGQIVPAPAPPERPRRRLPVPRSPLIDRTQEVTAACSLLRKGMSPVTLTGPGGSGKTRVALHVAAGLLDDFGDGVVFVPLGDVHDPEVVARSVAGTLEVRESGGVPVVESLKNALGDRHLLLVLDNFEQVIRAASLVVDLLDSCPHLAILVTSRLPLRVSGETEVVVLPLAVPALVSAPTATVERVAAYAGVELFIQRARDVKPDFALTNATAPVVAEICQRLDGLPLAIELAATRMKVLPPQALLARLDNRLSLLTDGARDLPNRQQTLRATIAWSEGLLNQPEQTLFRRLAVFAEGCTLDEVQAICLAPLTPLASDTKGEGQPLDALDGVGALVDANLLFEQDGVRGEPRFRMLETVRDYALERLEASGELMDVQRQHAQYFLALAEEAEPHLNSAARWEWLDRLEAEHGNLRGALVWSAAADCQASLRLAGALAWFWFHLGYLSEGRAWLERVLSRPEASSPTLARAKALFGLGGVCWAQRTLTEARTRLEESVAISRAGGDGHLLAETLTVLGCTLVSQGDLVGARAPLEESIEWYRHAGNRWGEAFALSVLGSVALLSGAYAEARERLEESLGLFQEVNDEWGRAIVLSYLAELAQHSGDNPGARGLYAAVVALFRDVREKWGLARALIGAGEVEVASGNPAQARVMYEESLALARELGYQDGIVLSLAGIAGVAGAQGQPERAGRLFEAADALSRNSTSLICRQEFDQLLEEARARLDPAAFAEGWAAGQLMTLEQAIAYGAEEVPGGAARSLG